MPRRSILTRHALAALVALVPLFALTSPSAIRAEPKRHHVTIGLGYQYAAPDERELPIFTPAPTPVWGVESPPEFSGLALGSVSYRYAVSPRTDLVFDARGTFASEDAPYPTAESGDVHYEHRTTWLGPGARFVLGSGEHRPYVQANLYYAEEQLDTDPAADFWSDSDSGVGFGFHGGFDFRLSSVLSLPVEMSYLRAMTDGGMNHFGVGAGLTFGFGSLP